jgi:hypothetical protein
MRLEEIIDILTEYSKDIELSDFEAMILDLRLENTFVDITEDEIDIWIRNNM